MLIMRLVANLPIGKHSNNNNNNDNNNNNNNNNKTSCEKWLLGGVLQKSFLKITQNSQKNVCARASS